MRDKKETILIKRAREDKMKRNYYYGLYLPMIEGMIKTRMENLKNNYN